MVPQLAPPCAPGIDTVSRNDGGVKRPSLRALPMRFSHSVRCRVVRMYGLMSATVSD